MFKISDDLTNKMLRIYIYIFIFIILMHAWMFERYFKVQIITN
jgi:uncharacterized membrane protein (DUF106 family)